MPYINRGRDYNFKKGVTIKEKKSYKLAQKEYIELMSWNN